MSRSTKSCCSRSPADRAGALLLALALAWTLAGCGSPAGQEPDTLRLGVALYSQDDTFIASLTQELERMVQEAEVAQGKSTSRWWTGPTTRPPRWSRWTVSWTVGTTFCW